MFSVGGWTDVLTCKLESVSVFSVPTDEETKMFLSLIHEGTATKLSPNINWPSCPLP